MQKLFWLFLLAGVVSCAPTHISELRCEGEAQTKKMVADLRVIENKEQLQKALPGLKKKFDKLAELVIQARSFPSDSTGPSSASDELFAELVRLYEIPGGRELIESAQSGAIHRLR